MTPFPLKIVSPDGIKFDGQVEELIVRTVNGDIGILAGHLPCVTPLGMGRATVIVEGEKRFAACIGGMLCVMGDRVDLLPTTFEWADEIDADRVEVSYTRAQQTLSDRSSSDTDIRLAQARLHRALVRRSVANTK